MSHILTGYKTTYFLRAKMIKRPPRVAASI